jgi:O-antigen ligase
MKTHLRSSTATNAQSHRKKPEFTAFVFALFVAVVVAGPLVFAYQLPPQPAFLNQILSAAGWLVIALVVALAASKSSLVSCFATGSKASWCWLAFWMLLLAATVASGVRGAAPWFSLVTPIATMLLVIALICAVLRSDGATARSLLLGVFLGFVIAAATNAFVALLQIAAPRWHDDVWIAAIQGERAYGNLRQPNLLALVALWGGLGAFVVTRSNVLRAILCVPPLFAIWASGSRAGWLALAIAVSAVAAYLYAHAHEGDRRTPASNTGADAHRSSRRLRIAIGLAVVAVALIASLVGVYGLSDRTDRALAATLRLSLWHDMLQVIASYPFLGVGYGQLNFAWTLTPLASRSGDVFDHAHNLPLNFAVELGLPLALALLALLVAAIAMGCRHYRHPSRWLVLGAIAIAFWQSLFEYPLWFVHFLLPVAALATLLVRGPDEPAGQQSANSSLRGLQRTVLAGTFIAGIALLLWLALGYRDVAQIYANANDRFKTLQAIDRAQPHFVYGHYADYAKIMLFGERATSDLFRRTTRSLIDEKLLSAWVQTLLREGRHEEAHYLQERAREFAFHPSLTELPMMPPRAVSAPAAIRDAQTFARALDAAR